MTTVLPRPIQVSKTSMEMVQAMPVIQTLMEMGFLMMPIIVHPVQTLSNQILTETEGETYVIRIQMETDILTGTMPSHLIQLSGQTPIKMGQVTMQIPMTMEMVSQMSQSQIVTLIHQMHPANHQIQTRTENQIVLTLMTMEMVTQMKTRLLVVVIHQIPRVVLRILTETSYQTVQIQMTIMMDVQIQRMPSH